MRNVTALPVAFLLAASPARSQSCLPTTIESAPNAILFGNGVATDCVAAIHDHLEELKDVFRNNLPTLDEFDSFPTDYSFGVACNKSQNIVIDALEAFDQLIEQGGLNADESDFWRFFLGVSGPTSLANHLGDFVISQLSTNFDPSSLTDDDVKCQAELISQRIGEGAKTVLVAHSQGNVFGNLAYDQLSTDEKRSFGMVSVATPASHVLGESEPYTTELLDWIHLVSGALPSNVNTGECEGLHALFCHFFRTYMEGLTGALISSDIRNVLSVLDDPDEASSLVFVANADDDTVSILEVPDSLADIDVSTPLPVGDGPVAIAADPVLPLVYVANSGDDTVTIIERLPAPTVSATVPVGDLPTGLAVDPAGGTIYVSNQLDGTVSVVDVALEVEVGVVSVQTFPGGIAVAPFGDTLYVANELSNTVSVVDTTLLTQTDLIFVGIQPIRVAFSPDGTTAYVTNRTSATLSVIEVASNTVSDTIGIEFESIGVVVNPDESAVYVTNRVSDTVSVFDPTTLVKAATINVGDFPTGIAVDATGSRIYVAHQLSNDVYIIESSTNGVVATVPVGNNPIAVAVAP